LRKDEEAIDLALQKASKRLADRGTEFAVSDPTSCDVIFTESIKMHFAKLDMI